MCVCALWVGHDLGHSLWNADLQRKIKSSSSRRTTVSTKTAEGKLSHRTQLRRPTTTTIIKTFLREATRTRQTRKNVGSKLRCDTSIPTTTQSTRSHGKTIMETKLSQNQQSYLMVTRKQANHNAPDRLAGSDQVKLQCAPRSQHVCQTGCLGNDRFCPVCLCALCICVCVYVCVCLYVCISMCVCVFVYVHLCVCVDLETLCESANRTSARGLHRTPIHIQTHTQPHKHDKHKITQHSKSSKHYKRKTQVQVGK